MTKRKEYSYDERCFELARYFYPNADEFDLDELAQEIQDAVENHSFKYPGKEPADQY